MKKRRITPQEIRKQIGGLEANLEKAFARHKIHLEEKNMLRLLVEIMQPISDFSNSLKLIKPKGPRKDVLAEIQRLRRVLKSLQPSTKEILDSCSLFSSIYNTLLDVSNGEFETMMEDAYISFAKKTEPFTPDNSPFDGIANLSYSTLLESCELALAGCPSVISFAFPLLWQNDKTGYSELLFGPRDENAVDRHTRTRGRSRNADIILLIINLAHAYFRATGKRPTESPSGPFADFVIEVLTFVNPSKETTDLRKTIHCALDSYRKILKQDGFSAYAVCTLIENKSSSRVKKSCRIRA